MGTSALIPSSNIPYAYSASITATSSAALQNNAIARYRLFFNGSSTVWIWLGLGTPAAVGLGIPLFPRGTYEMAYSTQNMYTGEIFAITESSTATLSMMEHQPNY